MQQHKLDLVQYRIDRAKETAEEAEIALAHDKLRLAENRIYYAMFYIIYALALVKEFATSKHTTLKGWFNKEFVFPGLLDKELYKIYNRAYDKRQEGDYDDFVTFEREEVEDDLKGMKKFLAEMEVFIKGEIEKQDS